MIGEKAKIAVFAVSGLTTLAILMSYPMRLIFLNAESNGVEAGIPTLLMIYLTIHAPGLWFVVSAPHLLKQAYAAKRLTVRYVRASVVICLLTVLAFYVLMNL